MSVSNLLSNTDRSNFRLRSKVVKKVYDLRKTRDLLKTRFMRNASQGRVGLPSLALEALEGAGSFKHSESTKDFRLPKLPIPSQRPTSRALLQSPDEPLSLSKRHLTIDPKQILKPTSVSPAILSGRLLANINLRRLSEGNQETINSVSRCAYRTKTGSAMGVPKRHNQDSFMIHQNLCEVKGQYAFGVFDGHGTSGHSVSGIVADRLPKFLAQNIELASNEKMLEEGLERAFEQTQLELRHSQIDASLSGSTAVVLLVKGNLLLAANVGDSRAVLGKRIKDSWKNRQLTRDHKPDWPDELQRILAAGGRVMQYSDHAGNPIGPHRVWLANKDIPGLAMSRSLGDFIGASAGVSSTPEIKRFTLTPDDKFIIIASDGLWEFMSSQEAVEIVGADIKHASAEASCEKLVREAVRRWNRQEDVVDDITVLVVYLNVLSRYLCFFTTFSGLALIRFIEFALSEVTDLQ